MSTCLFHDGAPRDHTRAGSTIRPAVVIRKQTYGNRHERGADTQAAAMSNFRTLKFRGHHLFHTIQSALPTEPSDRKPSPDARATAPTTE